MASIKAADKEALGTWHTAALLPWEVSHALALGGTRNVAHCSRVNNVGGLSCPSSRRH